MSQTAIDLLETVQTEDRRTKRLTQATLIAVLVLALSSTVVSLFLLNEILDLGTAQSAILEAQDERQREAAVDANLHQDLFRDHRELNEGHRLRSEENFEQLYRAIHCLRHKTGHAAWHRCVGDVMFDTTPRRTDQPTTRPTDPTPQPTPGPSPSPSPQPSPTPSPSPQPSPLICVLGKCQ